jgi:mannose/fructose-specific phosphotransferase system component IIA
VASTYVNNLRLEEMTTGEKAGTWGNITNTNLQLVGQALGYGTRAIANAPTDNITIADGASDADRSMYLKLTGGGQACTVTLLPNTSSKMWIMENATSYTLTFTQGSGANVAIPAGQTKMIFADGLGAGAVVYELGTIAVGGVQSNGAVTVGVDDTGHDVTFFGATTGKKLFWDESADTLNVAGTTALDGSLSVTGVTSNADGSAAAPSITNTGDTNTGIFFPAADTVGVAVGGTEVWRYGSNPTTAKNLIDNGAMTISQRGVNATILSGFDSTTNSYIADRFLASGGGTPQNRADLKHVSSGGPTGFANFIRYDVTTAETAVAAGEASVIQHRMEGFNLQSIQAASGVVALTLQFYMRSPKTGTHCVYLSTQNTRNIVKEFTVASADTWEKHTVSFIADTSGGTVSNAATEFLRVGWPIIAGTTYQGTADAWTASNIFATSNQQNLADNTANNIDITGVQLEVGSVATDFEHEDYGTTLAKCQRYFWNVSDANPAHAYFLGFSYSTTLVLVFIEHPVEMRVAPTVGGSADWGQYVNGTNSYNGTGTSSTSMFKKSGQLVLSGFSGIGAANLPGYIVYRGGKTVTFSAEL